MSTHLLPLRAYSGGVVRSIINGVHVVFASGDFRKHRSLVSYKLTGMEVCGIQN